MTMESLQRSAEKGVLRSIINRFGRVCVELVVTQGRITTDERGSKWSEDWNIDCDPLPPYSTDQYVDYLLDTDVETDLQDELNVGREKGSVKVQLERGRLFVYNRVRK